MQPDDRRRQLSRGTDWLERPARALDRWFGGRLPWATGSAAKRVAGLLCTVLALTIAPLELVPFGAAVALSAIATVGLALTLKDGALMLLASAMSVAALYGAWTAI